MAESDCRSGVCRLLSEGLPSAFAFAFAIAIVVVFVVAVAGYIAKDWNLVVKIVDGDAIG